MLLDALSNLPYRTARGIIDNITEQIKPQVIRLREVNIPNKE
jgi:hypothetical protein